MGEAEGDVRWCGLTPLKGYKMSTTLSIKSGSGLSA